MKSTGKPCPKCKVGKLLWVMDRDTGYSRLECDSCDYVGGKVWLHKRGDYW